MAVFPMFIELGNEICLVIGGGKVALRKVETLLAMGAEVHVISQEFEPELKAKEKENKLECHEVAEGPLAAAVWLETNMKKEGIGSVAMLICATNDMELNHQLSLWGKKHRIPVNSATSAEDCDFFFPSVVQRGNLTVGVSTGGRTPAVARLVSQQIQETLPDWYDVLEANGESARQQVHQATQNSLERKVILNKVLNAALEDEGRLTEDDVNRLILENKVDKKKE
ncbi:MAG: bifunctional precorrin-2 dehydrogenase/sirohydrochlorin ferrochelatase [Clostridia bacterium]|nr:bifunctional precorrin-2 dehydrogenase/sirohydrochlorin ferrochelatase [Lachnospiraceae bacterium]NCC00300.1 bifunctional precorrin-2 dehydrogenase/sirohydrochlorin ferrochelatase [Clostridia bacterium]NCD02324.1 bifunctional precorrin-2 dehydrogenase/sirohydrochlorin ferrochelatase [Clostridia bacterium]